MTPEEIELSKKRRVLERLKDRVADSEEEMTDLRSELERFEARYSAEVGRLYSEIDEMEAEIAEEEYKLVPDDEEIKRRAEELRQKAEESAARLTDHANAMAEYAPTPEARKTYHELARIIHPDLALDVAEKERRHALMADLNAAYSAGDQATLKKLAHDLRSSPELVQGDSVGDELVRALRQIYQLKMRIEALSRERSEMTASESYSLWQKVVSEKADGRDMLSQMAARARVHLLRLQRRLNDLKALNSAQEEYVKEKYGMDIEEFREGGHSL